MRWQRGLSARADTLAEVVSPLVIDSGGAVLPLRRNFPRALAFGDLWRKPLRELADFWIARRSSDFTRCYVEALSRTRAGGYTFTDFFDLLSEEAGRSCPAALAAAG